MLAVIALPNEASEALHRACGFERVGLLPEVGWKFDRWIDTAVWGLRLEAPPELARNASGSARLRWSFRSLIG